MRRLAAILLILTMFSGCSKADGTGPGMLLRERLLSAAGCSFQAVVTADYGSSTYTFIMDCAADSDGNVTFTVVQPESIRGISGIIDHAGGKLTFDDKVLAFPLLADEQLTPVSVPWLLVRTLRSGYIGSGGADGEHYKLEMDDSYEEDPLRMDLWLDGDNLPIHCDFLWNNRRIMSAEIKSFAFL